MQLNKREGSVPDRYGKDNVKTAATNTIYLAVAGYLLQHIDYIVSLLRIPYVVDFAIEREGNRKQNSKLRK